ncbi:60S ribosomal protein I1-a [Mycena amicta]|nr:60S ribosomal protein I1-a [Mycena amicta]KAJ7060631.1 60S ribosomal protein I1-a [Mycena amicta]
MYSKIQNYDPQRDKCFSGTVKLPNVPRPCMSICILADAADIDRAKQIELQYMSVNNLKNALSVLYSVRLNKKKKLVKKLAKKYDAFLSSETLIKQIPHLSMPYLSQPVNSRPPISHAEDLSNKPNWLLCLCVAIGQVQMTEDAVLSNVMLAINFLVSLLKKNLQNLNANTLHIKSTMGKPVRLF